MSKSIYSKGFIYEAGLNITQPEIKLPVLNSHNFKEGQEVVEGKDYEKQFEHSESGTEWHKYSKACFDELESKHWLRRIVATALNQSVQEDWNIGEKFTSPETGDTIFRVNKVLKHDVEASDGRSASGTTSFTKSYITKVIPSPAPTEGEMSAMRVGNTQEQIIKDLEKRIGDLEYRLDYVEKVCKIDQY